MMPTIGDQLKRINKNVKKDKTKETWSKLNELAEILLKDNDNCDDCPFFYPFDGRDYWYMKCAHPYEDVLDISGGNEYGFESNVKRPDKCPLRWRYK